MSSSEGESIEEEGLKKEVIYAFNPIPFFLSLYRSLLSRSLEMRGEKFETTKQSFVIIIIY